VGLTRNRFALAFGGSDIAELFLIGLNSPQEERTYLRKLHKSSSITKIDGEPISDEAMRSRRSYWKGLPYLALFPYLEGFAIGIKSEGEPIFVEAMRGRTSAILLQKRNAKQGILQLTVDCKYSCLMHASNNCLLVIGSSVLTARRGTLLNVLLFTTYAFNILRNI
jgi:hypothetical protein